jgi:hypothetical protein
MRLWNACQASVRPGVQTLVLKRKEKKRKNQRLYLENKAINKNMGHGSSIKVVKHLPSKFK